MDADGEKNQSLLNPVHTKMTPDKVESYSIQITAGQKNVLLLYPNQIVHLESLEHSRYELCKDETEIEETGNDARMFVLKIISLFAIMTGLNYAMAAWVLSKDTTFYLILFMLGIVYVAGVGMAFIMSSRKLKLMRWKIKEIRRRSVALKRNIRTFENSLNPKTLISRGQIEWENMSSGHVIVSFNSAKNRIFELIASLGPSRFWDDQRLYMALTGVAGVLCIATLGICAFYLRKGWSVES